MDQMAFDLNRVINEGDRSGKPVIVLSNEGKVLHGRKELEACVRSGASVSAAVIRGIKTEEWIMSDWPETMKAARQVFYRRDLLKCSPYGMISQWQTVRRQRSLRVISGSTQPLSEQCNTA